VRLAHISNISKIFLFFLIFIYSHLSSFFFVKIVQTGQRREYFLIMISASLMNRKLAITAIVMFAVVMGIASMTPAMAAKNKVDLCHYSAAEEVVNAFGVPTGEVISEHWKIINISQNGNAVNAHENNHAQVNEDESVTPDFQITDEDPDEEAANLAECVRLMTEFPPPEEETDV